MSDAKAFTALIRKYLNCNDETLIIQLLLDTIARVLNKLIQSLTFTVETPTVNRCLYKLSIDNGVKYLLSMQYKNDKYTIIDSEGSQYFGIDIDHMIYSIYNILSKNSIFHKDGIIYCHRPIKLEFGHFIQTIKKLCSSEPLLISAPLENTGKSFSLTNNKPYSPDEELLDKESIGETQLLDDTQLLDKESIGKTQLLDKESKNDKKQLKIYEKKLKNYERQLKNHKEQLKIYEEQMDMLIEDKLKLMKELSKYKKID